MTHHQERNGIAILHVMGMTTTHHYNHADIHSDQAKVTL